MSGKRVLVVEDDKHISKLVQYNLEKAGYRCIVTISGEDAIAALEDEAVDLMILDVMLPRMDGFEVCRQVRQNPRTEHLPIILLTARAEEVDRVVGLELGADDYVVKPFSPRELLLRVKAILKRQIQPAKSSGKDILECGDIKMDMPRHKVTAGNKDIVLTQMEFNLLHTLMSSRGRVQSRDFLLNEVWGIEADVTTRTIDTHVKSLRQKLGVCGDRIETVRGIGYRFKDDE
jgi:DNA-binding response OmpR family regulator